MRLATLGMLGVVLLAGCARQALFVVLPNAEGGGTGAITIEQGKTTTTLDQPYASAESRSGSVEPVAESQGNIGVIFREAIAARPILPHHFRLYFIVASDELTPASASDYHSVFDDIKRRAAHQIEVIGHTDTVGELRFNQALSLARAAAIRDRLVRDGVDRNAIAIAGRGERDLIVPTGDEVPEPRNRCVVITVR
jgi:outer membrane protein OmpA-like peptidoglycan-associated protein